MSDFFGYILAKAAQLLVMLFGIILLPWSIILVIHQKRFGEYKYEVARGWDILANKLFEPAFNLKLGKGFGGDETISERMAKNKQDKTNTKTADWWEKRINFFDKNHLEKTLSK